MDSQKIYKIYDDIKEKTNGEIYIGVVGPVRTGKSTFIKNFMDTLVIPQITDVNDKKRTIDELPQSGDGKTITTTEPKFIPKDAVNINFAPNKSVKIRLIDCVGFMVDGVSGHMENDRERMVKTPWSEKEIPFSQAALIGTNKVICDHSTIGLVITTDGSISDIPRQNYIEAEERTINELKKCNKPFLVLLNSTKPYSEETTNLAKEIATKHNVTVLPINCLQLKKNDINTILEKIISEFPISHINFTLPSWTCMLSDDNEIYQNIISTAKNILNDYVLIHDANEDTLDKYKNEYINKIILCNLNLKDGSVDILFDIDNTYYYTMLSELTGIKITNDYQLIKIIQELSKLKETMELLSESYERVKASGYSIIIPDKKDMVIDNPEIIKHGNKYGIKINATASSIHMIKTPITTEIAPIVGTSEQAEDLIKYINENDGLWNANIFGKSVEQLVEEGINLKINNLSDDTKEKMQDALRKIVNESNGGVICIII